MKFTFSQELEIECNPIHLRAIQPVLNGAILVDAPTDVQSGADDILLRYLTRVPTCEKCVK